MTGWVVEVALRGADSEAVARSLAAATGQAVVERGDEVIGFAMDRGLADQAVAGLLREFGDGVVAGVMDAPVEDWTAKWREGIRSRAVGRLTIGPSWLVEPGPLTVV